MTTAHRDRRHDIAALAGFLGLCVAVSVLGGLATASSVGGWYQTLVRPWYTPPDWVFAPVWSMLYAMIAIAGWRVWRAPHSPARAQALAAWGVQLALNLVWSLLFFGLQAIGPALIEIVVLLAAIAVTAARFRRVDGPAAALMLPYLAWVSFALLLNAGFWLLN